MFKTITIKEIVFKRLTLEKGKEESFSDLFERLLDRQVSGLETLRKIRGSIDLSDRLQKSD
ncbi:MAG: antitoxin VapB family protein [Candidatus Nitrosocosmicus sp.]